MLFVVCATGCEADDPATVAHTEIQSGPRGSADRPFGVIAQIEYSGDASQLPIEAKVFVFLRKPGVPMPLAVRHFSARDLPETVAFMTSEKQSNVELIARLSYQGLVDKALNDLEERELLTSIGHPPSSVILRLGAEVTDQMAGVHKPVVVHARVSVESSHSFPADAIVQVMALRSGTPMPLSLQNLALSELPVDIEIGGANATMFSNQLATGDHFTVRAYLTDPRSPTKQRWESQAVRVNSTSIPKQVELVIGRP